MQNVQYVIDSNGKPLYVQIPVEEYEKLLADAEALADSNAYRKAKRSPGKSIPFEEAFAQVDAYHQEKAS